MSRPYRIKLLPAGVSPYQTVGISGGPLVGIVILLAATANADSVAFTPPDHWKNL